MWGRTYVHEGWAVLPFEVRQGESVGECNPAVLAWVCKGVTRSCQDVVVLQLQGGEHKLFIQR